MRFEPQKDYMVVERVEVPKGIVLPESAKPSSDEVFRVLKVGPGIDKKPTIKKGDVVAIVGYITTISYRGEDVILVRAGDVVVVIEE